MRASAHEGFAYQLLVLCMLTLCIATTYAQLGIFYLFLLLPHDLNVEKEWPHCPSKKNMPSYMDIYYCLLSYIGEEAQLSSLSLYYWPIGPHSNERFSFVWFQNLFKNWATLVVTYL
jgi:hypothetical protein